jgi:hypothetical protein
MIILLQTLSLLCITSSTVFAAFVPTITPTEQKIITTITQAGLKLEDGNALILQGKLAQERIKEQRQEREIAAKKAAERLKNLSGKHAGGGSGRSYGGGHHGRGSHGGGYNPWGGGRGGGFVGGHGGYNPAASGYYPGYDGGYPYHENYDYDDEHKDPTSTIDPKTISNTETPTGASVDMRAQQEAAKQAEERERNCKELLTAAQNIERGMGSSPSSAPDYETMLQDLADDFGILDQAGAEHARTAAKNKDAKKPDASTGEMKKTTKDDAIRQLDSSINAVYHKILRHVFYAATMDTPISGASGALKTDMKRVLGKKVLASAAIVRANELFTTWQAMTPANRVFDDECAIVSLASNLAIINGTDAINFINIPTGITAPGTGSTYASLLPEIKTGARKPPADAQDAKQKYLAYFTKCHNDLQGLSRRFREYKIGPSSLGQLHKYEVKAKEMIEKVK